MTTTETKLNRLVYVDVEGNVFKFLTDATKKTVNAIPEIEWYAIKQVLINFGYIVIDVNENGN